MAVTGPDFVALQVRDLERAARFYTEQLGLRRRYYQPSGADAYTMGRPADVRQEETS